MGKNVNNENVTTKIECLNNGQNLWINSEYNFDNLGSALIALFVLSSKDGWVEIMYTGIDAVGVDKQPIKNYNKWMIVYFVSFLLLVGFFMLNMFIGVLVENFHRCREKIEKEEILRRIIRRRKKLKDKLLGGLSGIPFFAHYSKARRFIYDLCTSKYFDLVIACIIGLNVITMSIEFYEMPKVCIPVYK